VLLECFLESTLRTEANYQFHVMANAITSEEGVPLQVRYDFLNFRG
jgi:hypothetical protein